MSKKTLYDKTGAAFELDHEHDGFAYVRPLVKVVLRTEGYEGSVYEGEDFEPAEYLVTVKRENLFDAPPVEVVDQEISAKRTELNALQSEAKKSIRELNAERARVENELRNAKRQLDEWMKSHRVMLDLGKLLDGQVLYPLSVEENPYHHSRSIPRVPEMRNARYLSIHSGDFEKGQKWVCKRYGSDTYGSPFRFYDTEEERAAVIKAEFDETCEAFRKAPNFDTTSYTTSTTLHYGTLMEWVRKHPSLNIPDHIESMKSAHDANLVAKRKETLAAELAEIESREATNA